MCVALRQRCVVLIVVALVLTCTPLHQAAAQTALPGIVITTPSPIKKAPQSAAPQSPQQTAQGAQGTADLAPGTIESTPLPGSMLVTDDSFVALTVVTEREIAGTSGPTITDTLQNKPGISGTTFAAGADRPIIRGLDSYRVRVQENGVGTHDVANLSEDHAIPIDPFAADQIEVVRGPATLRYGSQAIGGVVDVINNRIPEFVPRNGYTAEVRSGVSSVDRGWDS